MDHPNPLLALLRGRRLARNAVVNIVGQGVPLIAALFTFPLLIAGLGDDRFGALTIVWLLVGYASIFDFGLGRALTQLVAKKVSLGQREQVAPVTWTALIFMLGTGGLATVAMYLAAPLIVDRFLDISGPLAGEARSALRLISLFLPIVILTTGVRGLLEAYQEFVLVNTVRIPIGLLNYLGPLAVLPFSRDLSLIVLALVLVRCAETLAYLVIGFRTVPDFGGPITFDRRFLGELVSFGGWMTVSNIIAPIMLNFDRFFIAGLVSLSAVAHYVTPYTLVTKLRIIPSGLMGVLFPAFSEEVVRDRERAWQLYQRSLRYLLLILGPLVALIVVFAKPGLTLWLDADFAARSFRVAQILAVGVLIHSLGQAPFTLVQAVGRPDLTAKLHLIEVPLYLAYLYGLIQAYGIVGAAAAWLIRVSLSSIVLAVLAWRLLQGWERPGRLSPSHD